jgi:glutathione synthase/RimK-type ligase-like ATP-grasp enzyme
MLEGWEQQFIRPAVRAGCGCVRDGGGTVERRARVALVTAAQAAGLDQDEPLLIDALRACNVAAEPVVWDDPRATWSSWDLAVLRSSWDYPPRRNEFLAWARRVDVDGRLRNRVDVITWNSDKRYLLELAAAGVPTVPSWILGPRDHVDLPDGDIVVKPAVSAGSQDTARYGPHEHGHARAHADRLRARGRDVLVQPYLPRVDERGETAMIYLADRYSHAIRKGPILRDATETVGGLFAREDIAVRIPSDVEHAVAECALDALPFDRADLLYARVDLLPTSAATPSVLEVELVEPSLFLRYCDDAPARFAEAISAHLPS